MDRRKRILDLTFAVDRSRGLHRIDVRRTSTQVRRRRPGWHSGCQGWSRCGASPAAAAGRAAGSGGRAAGAGREQMPQQAEEIKARGGAGGGRNQRWTVTVACQGAGAVLLLSGARAACTAANGFADVAALAMPSLSTTEAFAARTIRLLCRGLFYCAAIVRMRDSDAWVQLCCSTGRVLCAQLPPDSQMWRRCNCRV